MKLSRSLGLACLGMLLATPTWAEKQPAKETCPHAEGWRPSDEELQRILSDHRRWLTKLKDLRRVLSPSLVEEWVAFSEEWAAQNPEGKANLCNAWLSQVDLNNADLSHAELNNADLRAAKLNGATLIQAKLNNANLTWAELNNVDLSWAKLNNAKLFRAELNKATLKWAELNNADLHGARLNNAELDSAKLNNADLYSAELNNAELNGAELNKADLFMAKLNNANLTLAKLNNAKLYSAELNNAVLNGAELNKADLSGASLKNAELIQASVANAVLASADLFNALYGPVSQPPDSHVAGIKGLSTVRFASGRETGLVQLRELIQKAGLRDLEREATFAIENGKTKNAIADWREKPGGAIEGVFRLIAFDWTTAYGLHPARALVLIAALWALLIPVYSWPIRQRPRRLPSSGIYRAWPKDRVEVRKGKPTLENPARVERLRGRGPAALGWAAYFSLLSTFQIGFREFSVGTWLTRAQPRHFVLEPTGWVRTVSGLQSLLSVYLLALWILTYFGRPFQ